VGLAEAYGVEWAFVDKFAFAAGDDDAAGTISVEAWTFLPSQHLLLYEAQAWARAYHEERECSARLALATRNQSVSSGQPYGHAARVLEARLLSPRPAFWFLAIARCHAAAAAAAHDLCFGDAPAPIAHNAQDGVFMYYRLTMLNPGGYWRRHFSADEQGLYEAHIAFASFFLITSVACASVMIRREYDDRIMLSLLLLSLVYCLRHALMIVHSHQYATEGQGVEWAVHVSDACEYASDSALTLLFLALSKGWMISRRQLKRKTKQKQALMMIALLVVYLLLFLLTLYGRDAAATFHKYDEPTMRVLAVLRLLLLGWFCWGVRRSASQECRPLVQPFYSRLAYIGGLWLFSLPVSSAIVSYVPLHCQLLTMSVLLWVSNALAITLLAITAYPKDISPIYLAPPDDATYRRRPLGTGHTIAPLAPPHASPHAALPLSRGASRTLVQQVSHAANARLPARLAAPKERTSDDTRGASARSDSTESVDCAVSGSSRCPAASRHDADDDDDASRTPPRPPARVPWITGQFADRPTPSAGQESI